MNKYFYDFLCHPFTESIGKEICVMREDFPNLLYDVHHYTFQGGMMSFYEKIRQGFVVHIKEEKDVKEKEKLRVMGAEFLSMAAKWFALQFLFEEAYREKFSREVAVNMLKNDKFELEDIAKILPYLDEEFLHELAEKRDDERSMLEVLYRG